MAIDFVSLNWFCLVVTKPILSLTKRKASSAILDAAASLIEMKLGNHG